jgi:hypothetical protein
VAVVLLAVMAAVVPLHQILALLQVQQVQQTQVEAVEPEVRGMLAIMVMEVTVAQELLLFVT